MAANLVDVVSTETMKGDTPLEKEINAYLTSQFIGSGKLPDDECLSEARHLIQLITRRLNGDS